MANYRKIDGRMYADAKFRRLSAPAPSAQYLWIYLLTGPHTTSLPGLFISGEAGMAEALDWPLKGFREAFAEVCREGMARADWKARLVWIPNAIRYNPPESPNVVRSWSSHWDSLPECDLKSLSWQVFRSYLETKGEPFGKAFLEAFRKTTPNQEQEQEQEQDNTPLPPKGGKGSLPPVPDELNTPEFLAAWNDWGKHRSEIRKRLTPTTVREQFALLAPLGPEKAVAIIRTSIRNGWQGLFEPTNGHTSNGRQHETGEERIARLQRNQAQADAERIERCRPK